MSGSENEIEASVRKSASDLTREIGDLDISLKKFYELSARLTPTQNLLLSDTFGLLNGIALGGIDQGQPRIRDNLFQIVAELTQSTEREGDAELISKLASIISIAGTCGITAEGQSFSSLKHQRLR